MPVPAISMLETARETAAESLETLRDCLKRVKQLLETSDKYDDKLASHTAWLSRHVVSILGELRKLEASDRQAVAKMSSTQQDELVANYIRDLPRDRLEALSSLMSQLTATDEGVL